MLYISCPQGWKLRRLDPPSSSNRGMPGGTSGPDAQSRSAAIPPSYKVTRNAIFLNCEAFGYKSILENTFICISYSSVAISLWSLKQCTNQWRKS